jgi:hypothetical protein
MNAHQGRTAVRLVETSRGRHVLETTKRYRVTLYGEDRGELYFNIRGYVGTLPLPGGQSIDIGERPLSEFRREVARINREFREARRKGAVEEGASCETRR